MAERITVYGANWCGDTHKTLKQLDKLGQNYDYVDIDQDKPGEKKVIDFNRGKRRIPLIEIASDSGEPTQLSVPNATELDQALKKS